MHWEQNLGLFTKHHTNHKALIDSSRARITTLILQSFFNLLLINLIPISLSRLPHSFSITASISSFSLEGFGNFANVAALSPVPTFWSFLTTFLSCLLSSAFYQGRHSTLPGRGGHRSDQPRHEHLNFYRLPLRVILPARPGSPASFKTGSAEPNLKLKGRQDFMKFYSPFQF